MNSKDLDFEVDAFNNSIGDFIYAKGLLTASGVDSVNNSFPSLFPDAPVYKYTQGKAELYGGEVTVDIHPAVARWFDIYGTLSMVYGGLKGVNDSIKYLPFVPPTRITAELRFNLNQFGRRNKMDKVVKNAYVKVGMISCLQQNQVYQQYAVYSGINLITPQEVAASKAATAGYTLLNVGAGGDFVSHGGRVFAKLFVTVNNLLNTTYMDYMNRFKYVGLNPLTNRVGVFNMGRNVSIKLLIPLDIRKGS
jgi:iron complex outermembrane receptor protein